MPTPNRSTHGGRRAMPITCQGLSPAGLALTVIAAANRPPIPHRLSARQGRSVREDSGSGLPVAPGYPTVTPGRGLEDQFGDVTPAASAGLSGRRISPIKGGARLLVTAQGRFRSRVPIVLIISGK